MLMRRQRRKRHGKRGRAVLKRRERCLGRGRQQVPQWTAGGVRQHGRAGICWEYLKLLLSAAQGRGYWKHRKGLGKLQHWTAVYAWRVAPVAQGLPGLPSSHPSVFVAAVFGCRQGAAAGVWTMLRSSRQCVRQGWGMLRHQLMA